MEKFITVIFGGIDGEKNISLQTVRSFIEHSSFVRGIELYYMSTDFGFYPVRKSTVFSNSDEDFNHSLHCEKNFYTLKEKTFMNLLEFITYLKGRKNNIVYSLIHGLIGENGVLHKLFEKHNIPFIGSGAHTMARTFDKYAFNQEMEKLQRKNIFFYLLEKNNLSNLVDVYKYMDIKKKYIVKPRFSGSSIGVELISNYEELFKNISKWWNKFGDLLVEEYYEGDEFSIVLSDYQIPGGLITNEKNIVFIIKDSLYFYKDKYMINENVSYQYNIYDKKFLNKILQSGKNICKYYECRGLIRLDGIIQNDKYIFNDLNTVPAMDQHSIVFKSKIGTLREIFDKTIQFTIENYYPHLKNNIQIFKKSFQENDLKFKNDYLEKIENFLKKTGLPIEKVENFFQEIKKGKTFTSVILTGGDSNEKNISLLSGTNVYLQLLKSFIFKPEIFCLTYKKLYKIFYQDCGYVSLKNLIHNLNKDGIIPITWENFLLEMKDKDFIFLGLHGGEGEDGTIQKILEGRLYKFNGVNSNLSKIFMNKYHTILLSSINELNMHHYPSLLVDIKKKRYRFNLKDDIQSFQNNTGWHYYNYPCELITFIENNFNINGKLCCKPNNDGSSTEIKIINNIKDLELYIENSSIEMILIEEYVDTIKNYKYYINNELKNNFNNTIEMTVAVIGDYVFNPSMTIKSGDYLSADEKFESGLGVNLTPAPEYLVENENIENIRYRIQQFIRKLKIDSYCRIDFFYNINNNTIYIIEINSLPALTCSTVLFQQAAQNYLSQKQVLECIIIHDLIKKSN